MTGIAGTELPKEVNMPAWEYKVTTCDQDDMLTEEQLNVLGEAGLELITVVSTTYEEMVVGKVTQKNRFHYFFKRPKQAKSKG